MNSPEIEHFIWPLKLTGKSLLAELKYRFQLQAAKKSAITGKRDLLLEFLIKALSDQRGKGLKG
jgi:hypothetical protein